MPSAGEACRPIGVSASGKAAFDALETPTRQLADTPIRFPFGVRRRDSAIRRQMVATAWLSVANAGELPRAGGWLPFVACFDRR